LKINFLQNKTVEIMKKLTSFSGLALFWIFILAIQSNNPLCSQIISTPEGGFWDAPATWEGGTVPSMTDSVIIASVVSVNINTAACEGLLITSDGILQNHSNGNRTLQVHGSITNHGTIRSNPANYHFDLTIHGDMANHGAWMNRYTTLAASVNQQVAMSHPFAGSEFIKNATNGKALITTDLSFEGTLLKLNSDTLEFTAGNSISLDGGYITGGILLKESPTPLEMHITNGAYLYGAVHVNAPEIALRGEVLIRLNTNSFTGNLTNHDILGITNNGNFTLNIFGDLTNYGFIVNTPSYNLDLNITGSVLNHGNWLNRKTILTGTADHYLAFTRKFEGKEFSNSNAAASVIAITELVFDGTDINLNGGVLALPDNGMLSVKNGTLANAEITGNNIHFHSFNAFCQSTLFNANLTTHGDVEVTSSVNFAGNLTNEGVLRCRNYFSHTITIPGDFRNTGSVTNAYQYNLQIYAQGTIINNGIWNNQRTYMDGDDDQHLYLVDGHQIEGDLRLNANFSGSSFTWYGPSGSLVGNANFLGATSQTLRFLNPLTAADVGEYYCVNNLGEYSRSIFISTTTIPSGELDLTVLLEGPFNGLDMNTQLNGKGFLPLEQPYFDFPWVYPGMDSVVSVPSSEIVDWVLVELRDATAPQLAEVSTRIGRYVGFLLSNGSVIGCDGVSNINFPDQVQNNLYVIIRHRNHLDVMSAVELSEANGVYDYDFTSGPDQAYGINSQIEVAAGVWGMKMGDGYGDGSINLFDKIVWNRDGAKTGYYPADYEMKGWVNNQDKNDIWYGRLGQQSQIP
jgi:hypothetical protein